MRIKFLLLLLFIANITFGQSILENFNIKCGEYFDNEKYQFVERIIDTTFKDGTLNILLETYDNCARENSKGFIKILNDTVFLYYEQIPERQVENGDTIEITILEFCNCPFIIEFEIVEIESRNYKYKLNNKIIKYHQDRFKTFPVQFEIENGDTINLIDKFGLKQGNWIEKDTLEYENDSIEYKLSNIFYVDNEWRDGTIKIFHANGNIKTIARRENYNLVEISEYDIDGKFIKDIIKKK